MNSESRERYNHTNIGNNDYIHVQTFMYVYVNIPIHV